MDAAFHVSDSKLACRLLAISSAGKDTTEVSNPRRISDLYLDGTRLRVRMVQTPEGVDVQRKLGHKRRARSDPTIVNANTFEPPEWAGMDVTRDETFTGGSLAHLDADSIRFER